MDYNYIEHQTLMDIDNNRKSFALGHLYMLVGIAFLALSGFLVHLLFTFVDPAKTYGAEGSYIFEYILLGVGAFLIVVLLGLSPLRAIMFGVSYKYPLTLSYSGGADPRQSVLFGISPKASTLMKIVLTPIVIAFFAFSPLVLLALAGFVLPIVGVDGAVLTLISVLEIVSVLFATFVYLKFAMVPYLIADDGEGALSLKKTLKASWNIMSFENISGYIKVCIKSWLLQLVIFIPAIAGIILFGIAVLNLPEVADALGLAFLADLPIELPSISLMPKDVPDIDIPITVAGIIAAVGASASYVLNVLFAKLKTNTLGANFYNIVKGDYDED
ncbi:MAG: hypothetical protein LBP79_07720 [Clostridiales bacterium]|jgi:hypothetical protein|nr:hypothetical protein [Clostridiales bacterium]